MPTVRSAKWPFTRAGAWGLVTSLLPFAWLVDVDSCGHAPEAKEVTGLDLVGRADEWYQWLLVLGLMAVVIGAPFVAGRLPVVARALVNLVALGVTLFVGYWVYIALFFVLFSERTLRAPGVMVAVANAGSMLDAVARFGLSLWELVLDRRMKRDSSR